MNTETKPKDDLDDGRITWDSREEDEVDFTSNDKDVDNEDQKNKNGGRTLDEHNEKK